MALPNVIKTAKFFADEYGHTEEGQGYITLFNMLKKLETDRPYTIRTLYNQIHRAMIEAGLKDELVSFRVEVWGNTIKYEDFLLGVRVEESSPKAFLEKTLAIIKEKAPEKIAENRKNEKESDIGT